MRCKCAEFFAPLTTDWGLRREGLDARSEPVLPDCHVGSLPLSASDFVSSVVRFGAGGQTTAGEGLGRESGVRANDEVFTGVATRESHSVLRRAVIANRFQSIPIDVPAPARAETGKYAR